LIYKKTSWSLNFCFKIDN